MENSLSQFAESIFLKNIEAAGQIDRLWQKYIKETPFLINQKKLEQPVHPFDQTICNTQNVMQTNIPTNQSFRNGKPIDESPDLSAEEKSKKMGQLENEYNAARLQSKLKLIQANEKIEEILSSTDLSEKDKIEEMRKIAEEHHEWLHSYASRAAATLFLLNNVSSKAIGTCLLRAFSDALRNPQRVVNEEVQDLQNPVYHFRKLSHLPPRERIFCFGRSSIPYAHPVKNERGANFDFSFTEPVSHNITNDPVIAEEIASSLSFLSKLTSPGQELTSVEKRKLENLLENGLKRQSNTVVWVKDRPISLTHYALKIIDKTPALKLSLYQTDENGKKIIVAQTDNLEINVDTLNSLLLEEGCSVKVDKVIYTK